MSYFPHLLVDDVKKKNASWMDCTRKWRHNWFPTSTWSLTPTWTRPYWSKMLALFLSANASVTLRHVTLGSKRGARGPKVTSLQGQGTSLPCSIAPTVPTISHHKSTCNNSSNNLVHTTMHQLRGLATTSTRAPGPMVTAIHVDAQDTSWHSAPSGTKEAAPRLTLEQWL